MKNKAGELTLYDLGMRNLFRVNENILTCGNG